MGAEDDPSVSDDEILHRRVLNTVDCLVYDDNQGRYRPTSVGFKIDPDGMSVYRDSILIGLGLDGHAVAASGRGGLVYSFDALDARNESFGLLPDPVMPSVQPVDPAHALMTTDPTWSPGVRKRHLTELIRRSRLSVGVADPS